jgi:nitrate/nitrite-specific signal transduction histidine kinase
MAQATNPEPTLVDVINKLDRLTQNVERYKPTLVDVINKLDTLTKDVENSNERFNNYQQAVQWVVQLAFSLIASATITIIISSVLRK